MSRNASRINKQETLDIPEQQATYSSPTTLVELPSEGKFYPNGHPLYDAETVEIKQMTTREEEILTNESLIKKGVVIDRLIKSVLLDKNIKPESLLIGDRNAILIALRIDGYGEDYEVNLTCTSCGKTEPETIDLSELSHSENHKELETTEDGTFVVELPKTKAAVELKMMTGADETAVAEANSKQKKYGIERHIVNQYTQMIASVNGDSDPAVISSFASSLPVRDSRFLRKAYKQLVPDVNMSVNFQCSHCGHEQGLEVPITANFFWAE